MTTREQDAKGKKPWKAMKLTHLGRLSDLTRGGEGKLSALVQGDSGEPTKKPTGGPS